MDLILWRHAQAQDAVSFDHDMARRLTERGQTQARGMAAWLNRHLPETATVWASPALRTEQTVQALGRNYALSPALAPSAGVAQLLELVQWPHAKGCVLVVGHQPTLGQTLASLLGLRANDCAVKKGAVWWLRYRECDARAETVLLTLQSPEFL